MKLCANTARFTASIRIPSPPKRSGNWRTDRDSRTPSVSSGPQLFAFDVVKWLTMQNFTGARVVSVENCGVIKCGLLGVIGLVAMMFVGQTVRASDFDPVFGFYRPELFATVDGSTLLSDLTINDYLGG